MDEKEKKKAEQGPAWWYEPRGSKVREYGFLICTGRKRIPIPKADGILSSVPVRIRIGSGFSWVS